MINGDFSQKYCVDMCQKLRYTGYLALYIQNETLKLRIYTLLVAIVVVSYFLDMRGVWY